MSFLQRGDHTNPRSPAWRPIVRRPDPHAIRAGDVIVGLPSRGLHTNGFALVR